MLFGTLPTVTTEKISETNCNLITGLWCVITDNKVYNISWCFSVSLLKSQK